MGHDDAQRADVLVVPVDRGAAFAVQRAGAAAELVERRALGDVRALRTPGARLVWQDAPTVVPALSAAGVVIDRARDLRLVHRILADARERPLEEPWARSLRPDDGALFSLAPEPAGIEAVATELAEQEASIGDDRGLAMLAAAESMGAVVAVELAAAGLPFSRSRHDALLTEALGPRPASGRPPRMEALAAEVRDRLGDPRLNLDSQQELLRALHRAGIDVSSTAKWELRDVSHAAIEPLLAYKRLARLHTANGWGWADRWAAEGRLRLSYVPGGVVTGRWATEGSGAMQIGRQVRAAVAAEPGMRLVVADAAQLEPRALAAIARDEALADAGRDTDLYQGLVDRGVVDTRQHAKIGMLGALYGGTTGESASVLPRLSRAYPRAMGVVERAAAAGERRERVRTWLGRTSPLPGRWRDDERGLRQARAWGRFTRNFVVQGTAAEWALAWMAGLRRRLRPLPGSELVYFLHDEVIVHAPEQHAGAVAEAVRDAAADAGRLLFGTFPIDFPVQTAIVTDWSEARG